MRIQMAICLAFFGWVGLAASCDPNAGKTLPPDGHSSDSGNNTQVQDQSTPPTPDRTAPTPDTNSPTPDRTAPTPDTNPPTPDQTQPLPDQTPPPPDRAQPTPDTNPPPDKGGPDQTPPTPDTSGTPDTAKPDTTPPVAKEIRFVAIGDTGTGSSTQKAIAQAIQTKCTNEAKAGGRGPCDFGMLLGDNFYDIGVSSENDSQFKAKFTDMYHPLGFPFYITIGNHDFGIAGLGGTGFNFAKLPHYLNYAKKDPNFIFPQSFYTHQQKHVTFISLNTAELFFDYNLKAQTTFVQQALAGATNSTWRIAYGHHPYISNGEHGNAGQYEGIPIPLPYISGTSIKKFFDNELCGKIDFYICGHDHNIQVLEPKCGTNFVVSGAGAKTTGFGDKRRNKVFWQDDKNEGFVYIHIKDRSLTLQVLNSQAQIQFEKVYTK